jgi:uncharacterized protein involved in exopolysaccharide biosynthesis
MDEQIDLRPTVEYLLRYWWAPVGIAVALAALAAVYALTRPDSYQASALVVVGEPGQRVILDPRFEVNDRPDELLNVYPELALSDEVLSAVLPDVDAASEGAINTVPALRESLRVERGNDPRLMYLRGHHADANLAAVMANAWAREFVDLANRVYGNQGGQVDFYESQLEQSARDVAAAEAALTDYQGASRLTLATNQYTALSELQQALLAEQNSAKLVLNDIGSLRRQVSEAQDVTFADQYTALLLQVRALGGRGESGGLQLQVTNDTTLTTASRQEQLDLLDSLALTVETAMGTREEELDDLEEALLAAQVQIQVETAELTRLTRNRDVAGETYTAIARKLDEERLLAGQATQGIQLASRAIVPDSPASKVSVNRLVMAAVVGFLLGLAVVLAKMWREAGQARKHADPDSERRLAPATVE